MQKPGQVFVGVLIERLWEELAFAVIATGMLAVSDGQVHKTIKPLSMTAANALLRLCCIGRDAYRREALERMLSYANNGEKC